MSDHVALDPIVVWIDRASSLSGVGYGAGEALRSGRPMHLVHVSSRDGGWFDKVGRDVVRLAMSKADACTGARVALTGSCRHGDNASGLALAADSAALLVVERPPTWTYRRSRIDVVEDVAGRVDAPVICVP